MSGFALILDVAVVALLALTLPMAWRLDRMLRALRADRVALEQGADGLGQAAQEAEAVLSRLRAATEQGDRQLAERMKAAALTQDDLRYLVERAESIADKLEAAVQAARPMANAQTAQQAAAPRSEAERDLMRALGRVA
jgi:hypothetical protein